MSNHLRLHIGIQVAAAAALATAAIVVFPVQDAIGGSIGILFWIAVTLVASALPIQLPAGSIVSVSSAPILAVMALGGPAAAAIVGAIGTFEIRELRLRVPWYGTLNNHSTIVGPAVLAGLAYEGVLRLGRGVLQPDGLLGFLAIAAAGVVYNSLNNLMSALIVRARTGQSLGSIWSQDVRVIATNVVGLVPLAWLMSQVFLLPNSVGWWATLLFVVPLLTTRLAYSRYVETRELFEQTIGALANAVDARDKYTRGHSVRVSDIAEAMCREMKLSETEIEKIKWAGLLHDIGKIGIRDHVLLKPGPLDKHERYLMNQHPTIGAEIVAPAQQLKPEAPLIRSHHEWINGSGYPDGLEALDIPLGARILTIADAYEAMTSSRPYRLTPLTHEQAVAELEKFSGIQFDSTIVPVLVNLDRDILDRRPEGPDELPTMLHAEDPRDAPSGGDAGESGSGPAEQGPGAVPRIAASTIADTGAPAQPQAEPMTQPPSVRRGNAPRQALASDDVP